MQRFDRKVSLRVDSFSQNGIQISYKSFIAKLVFTILTLIFAFHDY